MVQFGKSWEAESLALAEPHWERLVPGVERFRLPGNEPVRRIITGRKANRVGGLYSWKNAGHVVHESVGEERVARLLEVHQSVTEYFGQPETLRVTLDGEVGSFEYTPDFLVLMGHAEIRVEYKRLCDIRPETPAPGDERGMRRYRKAALMRHRLRLVRDAYTRCGLTWDLWTDVDVAGMADPDVVDEILANSGRPITAADLERLLAILRNSPEQTATMAECEAALEDTDFARGDILSRITERLIAIDLFEPIGPDTPVKLTRARP